MDKPRRDGQTAEFDAFGEFDLAQQLSRGLTGHAGAPGQDADPRAVGVEVGQERRECRRKVVESARPQALHEQPVVNPQRSREGTIQLRAPRLSEPLGPFWRERHLAIIRNLLDN